MTRHTPKCLDRLRYLIVVSYALCNLVGFPAVGQSPDELVTAAFRADVVAVRALIAQGVTPNAAYANGHNTLARAAYEGHVEVVRLLLESGADPNLRDNEQQTALFWAVFRAQVEIAGSRRTHSPARPPIPRRLVGLCVAPRCRSLHPCGGLVHHREWQRQRSGNR